MNVRILIWIKWVTRASLKCTLCCTSIFLQFLVKCDKAWDEQETCKSDCQSSSLDLGSSIELGSRMVAEPTQPPTDDDPPPLEDNLPQVVEENHPQRPQDNHPQLEDPWVHRDAEDRNNPPAYQRTRAASQRNERNRRYTDYRVTETKEERKAPICPLCDKAMRMKRSRGGLFYGCSQYPRCNGTRTPDGNHPGPVKEVKKLLTSWGLRKYQEVERFKIAGEYPTHLLHGA